MSETSRWNVASVLEGKYNPWPTNWFLRVLVGLWSLPYGLIGLAVILLALVSNHAVWINPCDGGVDVVVQGWYANRKAAAGWAAITIGWTMFYWGADMYLNSVRIHERRHIKQALRLGLLMPLCYLILSLSKGYNANPLEIEAYDIEREYITTHDKTNS